MNTLFNFLWGSLSVKPYLLANGRNNSVKKNQIYLLDKEQMFCPSGAPHASENDFIENVIHLTSSFSRDWNKRTVKK